MPSLDLLCSIALHLALGLLSGSGWTGSLIACQRLERKLGPHIPFAGGVGALVTGLLLLLGGWRALVPTQQYLTALLLPLASDVFVVLVLLASVIWLGFTVGMGISLLRTAPEQQPPVRPFGVRRRR